MRSKNYFGTDGIRGLVGTLPINIDFAFKLGFATGTVFIERYGYSKNKTIVIGRDTRISGCMLQSAVVSGLLASGVNVLNASIDPMPTSSIAFLVKDLDALGGVVVSASHNPYYYNGFKFFDSSGFKLSEDIELEIEERINHNICYDGSNFGQFIFANDSEDSYINFCKKTFPGELTLSGLKIALDTANGAAYKIAPRVFQELGAEIYSIGITPNGLNINDGVGSLSTELLLKSIKENKCHLGIALDGDADRIIIIDSLGNQFNGDELLYIIIKDHMLFNKIDGVVGTHMTNYGFEFQMGKLGIPFCRSDVGDRFVSEELRKRGWLYGGENSGHLLCLGFHSTGDGIVAALQVLAAIVRSGHDISYLLKDLNMYVQKIVNIPWDSSCNWDDNSSMKEAFSFVKQKLLGRGRVLIRKSGTEPVMRLMVEAEDSCVVDHYINTIISSI
ncbi:phosphoglucosamine mutase [Candidatus Kinetoplastibacterium desouzaii TCC079E]|uniref:Phosphoglucosamine mutase n=1 Tax=Candidatus Kinetoplastidibacterium desouzai TCC079E TaxID=1208919 RepID=M1LTS9_9PROT|nr:phosphoglucosamine mutase [Candidatus Kinetoplastibacterium desouzaii]AGF46704.1 phosphoglucosamine mutase [Candidatus Kinetoplastibacterium desouzaii TCC079E]